MKAPAFQFYPSDWIRDLQEHPLEIEGAWIRICSTLWFEPDRGTATKTLTKWARVMRVGEKKSLSILTYLLDSGIADGNVNGTTITITSRRMVRDSYISNLRSKCGHLGGNPNLRKGQPNPYYLDKQNDNQKISTIDKQKITPSSSFSKEISPNGDTKKTPSLMKPIQPDGKEPHGEFVRLTEKEFEALQVDYGQERVKKAINDLNNYIGSTGKVYRSHYHRLRTWIEQDIRNKPDLLPTRNKPKPSPPPEPKPDYEPYRQALIAKHPKANEAFRERVIEPMRDEIGEHSCKAFIEPLVVESFNKESITLWVHPDSVSWVRDHYLARIQNMAGKEIKLTSEVKE